MSVKNPQVLEGVRGPREERTAKAAAPQVAGNDLIPATKRVYQSSMLKYQLQLTSPEDERLPNGRLVKGKPLRAVFVDGFLILDRKKDKETIEFLDSSDYNEAQGGNQFWDYQTVLDKVVEKRRSLAVETLSNPVDRAEIIAALQAEGIDFALPKPAASKGAGESAGA